MSPLILAFCLSPQSLGPCPLHCPELKHFPGQKAIAALLDDNWAFHHWVDANVYLYHFDPTWRLARQENTVLRNFWYRVYELQSSWYCPEFRWNSYRQARAELGEEHWLRAQLPPTYPTWRVAPGTWAPPKREDDQATTPNLVME